MPRLVFDKKKEFLNWLGSHVTPSQYEIFVTNFAELIVAPTKSTKTLRYGYVEIYKCWDDTQSAINEVVRKVPQISIYYIQKFDWDPTKSVGTRQTP